MNVVQDREFHGDSIELDGTHFLRCRFVDAELTFRGIREFSMQECKIEGDVRWNFADQARMMLYVMAGISLLPGGGAALGKAMMDVIRANRPERFN